MMIARKNAHWIGLAAGPFAWAVSTTFNYALAGWQCDHNVNATLPAALLLALIALAGVFVSAQAMRRETGSGRLLSVIGTQLGLLSAAIVLTQGAASLVIDACAR
jgi:hypothetical protein